MRTYVLSIKIDGHWQKFMSFKVDDPTQAFRAAMVALPMEHYDKPIRLEAEERKSELVSPGEKNASQ